MYTAENARTYTGTKVVKAWPMTRIEYNAYRGWTLPADENGDDAGYMVEYTGEAGNKANHPNHAGYVSWSPADVFDGTYREIGVDTNEPDEGYGGAVDAKAEADALATEPDEEDEDFQTHDPNA